MEQIKGNHSNAKKKHRELNRQYNTAIYLLRCLQLGLHVDDMEALTYGMVQDLFIESDNDSLEYEEIATQADFDAF